MNVTFEFFVWVDNVGRVRRICRLGIVSWVGYVVLVYVGRQDMWNVYGK